MSVVGVVEPLVVRGPVPNKLNLIRRFRGLKVVLALGDTLPPDRQLLEGCPGWLTLSDEVTAHCCTCPSDPAPAMQIDLMSGPQRSFDPVQNRVHHVGSW